MHRDNLITLSDYVYERTKGRLEGMTDAEYLWEPGPGCWTVRTGDDGVARRDDAVWPYSNPFTTLAWRVWHLCEVYGSSRNVLWLLDEERVTGFRPDDPAPLTASEGIARLDDAYAIWKSCLDAATDEVLESPLAPIAGPYAGGNRAGFVLHQLDEAIHHGAEAAMMRDLYRLLVEGDGRDPAVRDLLDGEQVPPDAVERVRTAHPDLLREAVANGWWRGASLLVSLDFDVNAPDSDGRTVLHLAAAGGKPDLVRQLLAAGADPTARDSTWNEDAVGWARYFNRASVIEILESART